MKPIIEIKNLNAGYDGRTVLRDVNLTVYDPGFSGYHRSERRWQDHSYQMYFRIAQTAFR